MLNGIADFSPFSTPRAVEGKNICTLPTSLAIKIWTNIYNLNNTTVERLKTLSYMEDVRVEFSIHPNETQYTI